MVKSCRRLQPRRLLPAAKGEEPPAWLALAPPDYSPNSFPFYYTSLLLQLSYETKLQEKPVHMEQTSKSKAVGGVRLKAKKTEAIS
jgi:hypothetical protein